MAKETTTTKPITTTKTTKPRKTAEEIEIETARRVREEFEEQQKKSKEGKKKKRGKREYEQLPERELRRQLKRIEIRATRRVVMITLGIFSISLGFLAQYTLSIVALLAVFIGVYGTIYSLFSFIRIRVVKWYFIIIGLAINIAGIALSIAPTIALFQHILQNLDAITAIF